MSKYTLDQIVGAYIKLRDQRDEVKRRQQEELSVFTEKMGKLESILLQRLNEQGAQNVKTEHGTVYRSKRTTAKVDDFEVALRFIREHEYWHCLPRSVNKTAVEDYQKETGEAFPGVTINADFTVGVRRS